MTTGGGKSAGEYRKDGVQGAGWWPLSPGAPPFSTAKMCRPGRSRAGRSVLRSNAGDDAAPERRPPPVQAPPSATATLDGACAAGSAGRPPAPARPAAPFPLADRRSFKIIRPFNPPPENKDGPRVNDEIRVPNVRVVDANAEQLGVMAIADALRAAAEAGLDLVEVAPNADPPVCKILDFGKYKYEEQKKKNEARKKQKVIEVKEIKMRPGIDEHDYQVKMRSMRRFIDEGDRVKVTIRFRGRELAHQDLGLKVLDRVREDLDGVSKVEQLPKIEGRQMVMVIAPR